MHRFITDSLTAARGRLPGLPHGTGLALSIASIVVLVAVATAYGTVVTARLLGYRVVVTEHTGETTSARSLLFVRSLPLEQAHTGQRILVRDARRGMATVEIERIVALRHIHGAVVADTERVEGPSAPRLSVLTRRIIVPAGSVPELGALVGLLTSPIGWLLALVLPAAGLATSILRRIWLGSGQRRSRSPMRGIPVPQPDADAPPVLRPLLGADPLKETS